MALHAIEKAPHTTEAEGNPVIKTETPHSSEPRRQKWYGWFAPTDTPAERKLILKLDGLIVVFASLSSPPWRIGLRP